MRKNRYAVYIFFPFVIFTVLLVGGNLHAQETAAPSPSGRVLHIALSFTLKAFLNLFPLVLITFLPVVVFASLAKIWLLKQKLSLPWQLKPMEKLAVITFSDTLVELFFLLLIVIFFAPALVSVWSDIGITFAATRSGRALQIILHTLIVTPYHCVIGAILILLLINLLVSMNAEKRRQYIKFSAALAVITPGALVIYILIRLILSK